MKGTSQQYIKDCPKITNPKFDLDQNGLMFPTLDFEVVFNKKTSTYYFYDHYEYKPQLIQNSKIDKKLFR